MVQDSYKGKLSPKERMNRSVIANCAESVNLISLRFKNNSIQKSHIQRNEGHPFFYSQMQGMIFAVRG